MIVVGLAGDVAPSPVRAAEVQSEEVVGGWLGELPCPFTAAKPSASAPRFVRFECVSGSTWDGVWVGHTVYKAVGTLDIATGDIHAIVGETLFGVISATRAAGTLKLIGTVDVDGATGTFLAWEQIVGGTGAFEGSSGDVVFEGFQAAAVAGHGGYHGTWTHP
jgi:hypothetical protein